MNAHQWTSKTFFRFSRYLRSSLVLLLGALALSAADVTYDITVGPGDQSIVVAAHDSLNLTAGVSGTARILRGSGVVGPPFPVHVGEVRHMTLHQPGRFIGTVSDVSGTVLGSLTVTVVSTTISSKAIADQVGFTRDVSVGIQPENAPITFAGNDPSLLTVTNQTISGTMANFSVKTLKRGKPILQAQIQSPTGLRTIAQREVDEFTLETGALSDAIINVENGIGRTHLTMRPYVKDIEFDFSMFAHSSTFIGGATSLKVFTTTSFIKRFDPVTSEIVGDYYVQIEMPPRESRYCFRFKPFQDDPVPIGDSGSVNGHGCKVDVDTLIMCVNDTQPLLLKVAEKSEGKHAVKILRKPNANAGGVNAIFTAPDTSPDSTTWGKKLDCGVVGEQTANKVKAGNHCEKYDVEVEDTLFTDRIQVTDEITLDVLVAGPVPPPNEFDKSFRLTIGMGKTNLGPAPATPSTGADNGKEIVNASVVVGTICAPINAADKWTFARAVRSKAYLFKPGDVNPMVVDDTDPPENFGPPNNNDGPGPQIVDVTPSPSNKIYSADTPGFARLQLATPPNYLVGSVLALRLNAVEWVLKNGAVTDCTPILPWYARVTIKLTATGWVRVGTNDSGRGHRSLSFTAAEAAAP